MVEPCVCDNLNQIWNFFSFLTKEIMTKMMNEKKKKKKKRFEGKNCLQDNKFTSFIFL